MEKKRTKIAYFTAVGVFLVLLVVLGLTYRETPLPTLEVEGEPELADTPFAGHKQSGFGVENGLEGFLEYMAPQSIYVPVPKRAAS